MAQCISREGFYYDISFKSENTICLDLFLRNLYLVQITDVANETFPNIRAFHNFVCTFKVFVS